MSCHLHRYSWPSLATSPYHSSPPAGLQGYIPYPHIAAVCMFKLVVLLFLGHMWGSIGVHHLWARLCFPGCVLQKRNCNKDLFGYKITQKVLICNMSKPNQSFRMKTWNFNKQMMLTIISSCLDCCFSILTKPRWISTELGRKRINIFWEDVFGEQKMV